MCYSVTVLAQLNSSLQSLFPNQIENCIDILVIGRHRSLAIYQRALALIIL